MQKLTSSAMAKDIAATAAARCWAESLGDDGFGHNPVRLRRPTCWAVWHEDLAAFEVLQPRGDYLRSMGTTWRSRIMLHAEEGLWLVERGMLAVHPLPTNPMMVDGSVATATSVVPSPELAHIDGAKTEPNEITIASSELEKAEQVTDQEHNDTEGEGGGRGGAADEIDPSTRSSVPAAPPMAGCKIERSKADPSSPYDCGVPPAGEHEHTLGPAEHGNVARARQAHGRRRTSTVAREERQRAGAKRGRSGTSGSDRGREASPSSSVSVGALHEMVLLQAGVPWECYRAYAALKQRSYVVRRQPEDTVGHNDHAPRAAPLSWIGCTRSTEHHHHRMTNNNDDENLRSSSSSSSMSIDASDVATPSTSLSSSFNPILPLPVTFHVYNNPPGSFSFSKRNPGSPHALLAVCRFGDRMPEHRSLAALAERYSNMRASTDMARRWGRLKKGTGKAGLDLGQRECSPGRRRGGREEAGSGRLSEGLISSRGSDLDQEDSALLHQDSLQQRGGIRSDQRRESSEGQTGGGIKIEKGGGGSMVSKSGGADGMLSPGVLIAVVSGEARVHLFDVGLHDTSEAVDFSD